MLDIDNFQPEGIAASSRALSASLAPGLRHPPTLGSLKLSSSAARQRHNFSETSLFCCQNSFPSRKISSWQPFRCIRAERNTDARIRLTHPCLTGSLVCARPTSPPNSPPITRHNERRHSLPDHTSPARLGRLLWLVLLRPLERQ